MPTVERLIGGAGVSTTAEVALKVIQTNNPKDEEAAKEEDTSSTIQQLILSGDKLSAAASEAMMNLAQSFSADQANLRIDQVREDFGTAYERTEYMSREELFDQGVLSDIRSSELKGIAHANAYRVLTREEASERDFQAIIVGQLSRLYGDDDGFQQALADGTLVIQRSGDDNDVGFSTMRIELINILDDAFQTVDVLSDPTDSDAYQARSAEGYTQTFGVFDGLGYYAYW